MCQVGEQASTVGIVVVYVAQLIIGMTGPIVMVRARWMTHAAAGMGHGTVRCAVYVVLTRKAVTMPARKLRDRLPVQLSQK